MPNEEGYDERIAARCAGFAEIAQQRNAAAIGRFAIADERIQSLVFAPFTIRVAVLAIDKAPTHADIVEAVEHTGFGRQSVAARAPDLLIVGFDTARNVGVEDEADVGFIDPHSEGDGRHHDHARRILEFALVHRARLRGHTRVIWQST